MAKYIDIVIDEDRYVDRYINRNIDRNIDMTLDRYRRLQINGY